MGLVRYELLCVVLVIGMSEIENAEEGPGRMNVSSKKRYEQEIKRIVAAVLTTSVSADTAICVNPSKYRSGVCARCLLIDFSALSTCRRMSTP
jgi:hypothetical protein